MAFDSLEAMSHAARSRGVPLWEAVLAEDMASREATREDSLTRMDALLTAMENAAQGYAADARSLSGMAGGEGAKMAAYADSGAALCGSYMARVMAQALAMGECNACMKRIVAAPTAGACGVLPAVLLPAMRLRNLSRESALAALYVAAGVGEVIAQRASISGAQGGCQAEIGSAAAMAAAALCSLQTGDPDLPMHACALALKGLMGLVCDPVAGLVEVPCVKRNAIGALIAMGSADMALAGVLSQVPPDQVVDAMREVGEKMDASLRETGNGGLAATRFGQEIKARMLE